MTSINWNKHNLFSNVAELSKKTSTPILIFFHSASCNGCTRLVQEQFVTEKVVDAINTYFIPVWVEVETKAPDDEITALVGSHIFIMSPVLQVITPEGDIVHKVNGAPLHTRLDMGYTRTHSDYEGCLNQQMLLNQLYIGLGRYFLDNRQYGRSADYLARVGGDSQIESDRSVAEAEYWLNIANRDGEYPNEDKVVTPYSGTPLVEAVNRFCLELIGASDDSLMRDWQGQKRSGSWQHYTDCLREVALGIYQLLMSGAQSLSSLKYKDGIAPSAVEMICGKWQLAYRTLQGSVFGLSVKEMDQHHYHRLGALGKQRTIRNNLVHCVMAEYWAHGHAIRQAVESIRDPKEPLYAGHNAIEKYGQPPLNGLKIETLFELSDKLHVQLINECLDISDDELAKGQGWWESSEVTIEFRLWRMCWHLHDHAAVVDTICERIGRKRRETERLARLIYTGLGELESASLGVLPGAYQNIVEKLVNEINSLADDLSAINAKANTHSA